MLPTRMMLHETEVFTDEVYAELKRNGIAFEYEHGVIRFWVGGEKREIKPVRWKEIMFSEYPVYDIFAARREIDAPKSHL